MHPRVGLPMLADTYGDLSGICRRTVPLPPPLADSNAVKSGHEALVRLGRQPGMTISKLYKIMAGASGPQHWCGHAGRRR